MRNTRLRHALLVLASLAAAAPLLWMLWASVKRPGFGPGLDILGPRVELLGPYAPAPAERFLRFELFRPGALDLAVAGTFNDWTPAPMTSLGQGRFRLDVAALPGQHEYKFVVDGSQWGPDPVNAPRQAGGENSRITLPENRPLALNHSGVRDRSFREGPRLVPVVAAPDATEVRLLRPGKPPLALVLGSATPPLDDIPDGPAGQTVPGADCFVAPPGLRLEAGEYSLELSRGLAARVSSLYTLENYQEVLEDPSFPFGEFFLNSLVVALGAALFTTLLCTLGGYAFATKDFPGKGTLFRLCLASMMVPGMIYMVPQYAVVTRLGWINGYMGMIVPHLANVFGLLLMTNYIRGLPQSLFEAARIDGASEVQILRHVLTPLAMPAMATLFTLTFMGQWSNFLWQLIVNTPESPYRTLPVGLALFKGQYDLKVEAMMAAAAFSVVPVSVVFFLTQRQLIAGLTSGSVKE